MPGFDRSSPAILVGVRLKGKKQSDPLDLEGRVVSFSFTDEEKKTDKGVLVLDNFDLTMFEERNIVPGTILDVTWGYNGLFSQTQSLVVKSLKGGTTLTVNAESKKQLINLVQVNNVYEEVRYSDIAQDVAEKNGFRKDQIFIDDTEPVFETVTQARMTDAQFLRHLSNKIGFEWYVDADGFHFHDRKIDQEPLRKFIYYNDAAQGDIMSFSIEEKTNARVGKVTAKGRDPNKKKNVNGESNAKTDKEKVVAVELIAVGPGASGGLVKVEVAGTATQNTGASDTMATAAATEKAAAAIAKGRQRRSGINSVKLTMNCVGDPEVVAKAMIEVAGIGKSFSGLYYVEKVAHKISASGYTMQLTCKRKGRNSSVSGVSTTAKTNKKVTSKKKDERKPETEFVFNDKTQKLEKKTVYKKTGKLFK